jgi:molybdenum cofactor cytidylyltransferase
VKLGVVILGAGFSSRMGQPKLLLPWGNTTVIGHLVGRWRELRARQIAVVIRSGDNSLGTELERVGITGKGRIFNPEPERGMFSSIRCAAAWPGWDSELDSFLIALGDQPQLANSTLQRLLDFHREHPDAICQPSFGGSGRHPVIVPRAMWSLLAESEALTLKDFLRGSAPLLECPIDDPRLTLDLDTPEDYKSLVGLNPIIAQ